MRASNCRNGSEQIFAEQTFYKIAREVPGKSSLTISEKPVGIGGCISSTDHEGRQFWVVAAEREDAGRFIVHAHDVPSAFLEQKTVIHRQRERG